MKTPTLTTKISIPTFMSKNSPITTGAALSPLVFILASIDKLIETKEGKKKVPLKDSLTTTREAVMTHKDSQKDVVSIPYNLALAIFTTLKLACETQSPVLQSISVDCLGKLISYSYLSYPEEEANFKAFGSKESLDEEGKEEKDGKKKPLTEQAVDIICDCFYGETTEEGLQLQIIKVCL